MDFARAAAREAFDLRFGAGEWTRMEGIPPPAEPFDEVVLPDSLQSKPRESPSEEDDDDDDVNNLQDALANFQLEDDEVSDWEDRDTSDEEAA